MKEGKSKVGMKNEMKRWSRREINWDKRRMKVEEKERWKKLKKKEEDLVWFVLMAYQPL